MMAFILTKKPIKLGRISFSPNSHTLMSLFIPTIVYQSNVIRKWILLQNGLSPPAQIRQNETNWLRIWQSCICHPICHHLRNVKAHQQIAHFGTILQQWLGTAKGHLIQRKSFDHHQKNKVLQQICIPFQSLRSQSATRNHHHWSVFLIPKHLYGIFQLNQIQFWRERTFTKYQRAMHLYQKSTFHHLGYQEQRRNERIWIKASKEQISPTNARYQKHQEKRDFLISSLEQAFVCHWKALTKRLARLSFEVIFCLVRNII